MAGLYSGTGESRGGDARGIINKEIMDKWKNYLRSALCSIKHNKVYALFCVVGMFGLFMQNSESIWKG